jgi:glutamine amidotransferase
MCRLLLVKSVKPFEITPFLEKFSYICGNSKEFQGDGWGIAYLNNNNWHVYKNIKPIWKDDFGRFGKTTQFLAHARSAFRNQDIGIENNMPFYDGNNVFIFNGELNGVRIKEQGRIGAEKIFNFIKRFNNGDMANAIKKGVEIIKKRSSFIGAMNFIISDREKQYLYSSFSREPEYFTMHKKEDAETLVVCSDRFSKEAGWSRIENDTFEVLG